MGKYKRNPKKALPPDLQLKIMVGDIDTEDILKILHEYDLSAEESNIVAHGLKIKNKFDLAEKLYNDSLKGYSRKFVITPHG
jgi:hypothetical protein